MSEQTLILIEAAGIQDYIFGSNQLAQNIGASELVTQATTDWVYDELPPPHNVDHRGNELVITNRSLRVDELAAEVVYWGGGNAMLTFADDEQAVKFTQRLTRRAIEQTPGLDLVLVRKAYNPEVESLVQLHQDLRGELAKRKLNRPRSSPLLGLGVTAACVYTGLPAIGMSNDPAIVGEAAAEKALQVEENPILISANVAAKRRAEQVGKDRLKRYLPQVEKAGYEFIYDFDDFGEKGESSYLAVIHTDGNNMGERIKKIGEEYLQPERDANENYVQALRAFSESIKEAAKKALNATVDLLLAPGNLEADNHGTKRFGGVVPLQRRRGKNQLPFRPIVFGGDDVTFVAEGRLGLTLAAKYLETYSGQKLSDPARKPAYARTGIAVVKSHYPFSRAYRLVEELIGSAKAYIHEHDEQGEITALDWHFAVSGLVLPLEQVREREYEADDRQSSLLMRPVRLGHPNGDWRSWQTFTELVREFREKEGWAERRNKIKAFRDSLRAGPEGDAVQNFLRTYDLKLPQVEGMPDDMKKKGWQGPFCGYFDAIEALDFYVPLKGE